MNQEQRTKQLERLTAARQRAEARLQAQQQRVNQRFDALEKRLEPTTDKPADTRQRIITAALQLLDQDGLNELSLRKLAAQVGLKAPALYWYFKNKEELVDYLAEAMLLAEFAELVPRLADEPWQDWLVQLCKRLRSAMLAHRDGARIVAGAHLYPAVTLAQVLEVASESLSSAGLAEPDVELLVSTTVHFTFGRVIEEQSSPSLDEIQQMDYEFIADTYPRLARTIKRIQTTGQVNGFGDDSFEQSLRLMVR